MTLGFATSIYRQPPVTMKRGETVEEYGEKLMSWDTSGLEWIQALVKSGKARQVRDDGYPMVYVGEREAVSEALVDYWLDSYYAANDLYLRAREPEEGSWLQSLDTDPQAPGVTRQVLWGTDSVPTIKGLNCDSDLDWIDKLVETGYAELVEDGEEKLYCGKRWKLVAAYVTNRLAASQDDEALVVTAWDLS